MLGPAASTQPRGVLASGSRSVDGHLDGRLGAQLQKHLQALRGVSQVTGGVGPPLRCLPRHCQGGTPSFVLELGQGPPCSPFVSCVRPGAEERTPGLPAPRNLIYPGIPVCMVVCIHVPGHSPGCPRTRHHGTQTIAHLSKWDISLKKKKRKKKGG